MPTAAALRAPMPPLAIAGRAPRGLVTSWPYVDRTSERPGYMLTPERVWQIHREGDGGVPRRQCLMFEDVIESDGHLRGAYDGRMRSVADREYEIAPGTEGGNEALNQAAAEALRIDLARTNLPEAIWHHQESVFYGYAGTQPIWDIVDQGRVAPIWFDIIEHQRWSFPVGVFDLDGQPRLRTLDNPWPGIALEGPAGSWWFTSQRHRLIQRSGLMRTAVWWAVFKRMSVRDWMVFAEKFGLPIVIGQFEERAADERRGSRSSRRSPTSAPTARR
jgi:phage gp29-like protein